MARALIVGCGCRGRELGAELAGMDWHVRGTSRCAEGMEAIEAAGIEPARADPDRVGTVLELCGDIAVVVWLLGSVKGESEALSAIHGARLESLLEKLVDSPVRGFAYEAVGSVDRETLSAGSRIVEWAGETWRIPVALLGAQPGEVGWARQTARAVADLLV